MYKRRAFRRFGRRRGSKIFVRQTCSFATQIVVPANGSIINEAFVKLDTALGGPASKVVKKFTVHRIKYWSSILNTVSGTAAAPLGICEAVYAYDVGSLSASPYNTAFTSTLVNQWSNSVGESVLPNRFFGRRFMWPSDGSPVGSNPSQASSAIGAQGGNNGDGSWTMKVRRNLVPSDAIIYHIDFLLPGSGTAATSTWLWSFASLIYYSVTT
jgi:hypothetical protein